MSYQQEVVGDTFWHTLYNDQSWHSNLSRERHVLWSNVPGNLRCGVSVPQIILYPSHTPVWYDIEQKFTR